jgi:hypothetical protein
MFTIEPETVEIFYTKRIRYPFEKMCIGDSFFIDDYKKSQSARVSAFNFSKKYNSEWKFSLRKINNGWRIYRIH